MGAVLGKCTGQLDDKKVQMAIDKGFAFFDTDKSGFIDGNEACAAARKALSHTGPLGAKVTDDMIQGVFNKYAGPDKKMDKAEFGNCVAGLVERVGGPKAHTTTATTATHAAAPTGAAAAADTAVAAA
jgi:hypothetical protein